MGIRIESSKKSNDNFLVIPHAWDVATVFLMVQTQWRVSSGCFYALDYGPVKWVIELLEIKKPLEVLTDLQIIEAKVVEILSSRSEK